MLEIKKYELRITNYSSAHSRHNERKMAANCGKNAAERDKSRSARRSHRMALGAIKATPVAIWVVTTLPAVPPVRKQKSIAFSMLSPYETLRWFLWGPRDWFS